MVTVLGGITHIFWQARRARLVVPITDAAGDSTTVTYDPAGNPTGLVRAAPDSRVATALTAAYDAHQRLASLNDGLGTQDFVHDAIGRLTQRASGSEWHPSVGPGKGERNRINMAQIPA